MRVIYRFDTSYILYAFPDRSAKRWNIVRNNKEKTTTTNLNLNNKRPLKQM